ncbi:galactosyl transferase GMA12/MNN10 family protein (glycosyl transferase family 34) [Metarhizium robertsii]|uniref:Galactosyl transferase n=2 Tax=Metarhizium robertsii TaxID=568076 RepID=E9EZK1_METRA|nr:Galactosyl transferase [Metarhizium robertsii ARSEF 23]EFY99392.1 Galactosyl transferase [Metarhizium robertsii ARSEF 23]EXV04573.1 galactosyl transferase GMA12/MNN10 family protein (glycosyl transferase family 34) [Metarhizium robertsii]
MLNNSVRSTKGMAILVGAIFFVAAFVGLVYNHLDSWNLPVRPHTQHSQPRPSTTDDNSTTPIQRPPPDSKTPAAATSTDDELRQFFLKQMYKPALTPDEPFFKPYNAFEWRLPEAAHWQQPMGENLCIIDLDNRLFNESGQVFGPDVMDWDSPKGVHGLSLGLLNHYVYARIHGYKYYYINTVDPGDRRASWKKPPVISKILKEHDVCIYLDSDAIFHYLDLPFEWLMNYWRLYPDTNSMALAVDPDTDWNKDRFGKLYLNTGFIISQNNPMTYKIMDAWNRCPDDDSPYPECKEFRLNAPGRPTDQGGFGTFVRYNYTEHIRELPCTEANGFPQTDSGCDGIFVRHLWTGKDDQIKIDVGTQMPGPYLKLFHEQYLKEKPTFYIGQEDLLRLGPSQALKGKSVMP